MMISLRAAYELYRREPGSVSNSYDWYRKQAQKGGLVRFGNRRQFAESGQSGMPVTKVKGQWMVNQEDLDAELAEHRASRAELEQVTADYHNRILHGRPGSAVRTSFGNYTTYDGFHSIWRSDAKPWKETDGYWLCSRCWQPATLTHGRPQCHRCSDWNGCGRDCTLSKVTCRTCGTSMAA
jgi:hypothetical protein